MALEVDNENTQLYEALYKSQNEDVEQHQQKQQEIISNDVSLQQQKPQQQPSKHTFRSALPQILAVSAKNILLLTYGMTLGFPTIVIPALQSGEDILTLTKAQISWFSSINLICVPLGCVLSGALAAPIGRKRAMMFLNAPFIVAWILFYYADSVALLYTCLVLTGLSGGLLEAPVLTYVAEITQPHLRGMLSAASSMSVIFGVFIQFLMGGVLPWRTVAAVNVTFPVLAFIALCFVPESPYWLVGKDRLAEAERSLCWLRGWVTPADVHVEFTALVASLSTPKTQQRTSSTSSWRHYTHRTFVKPYFLVSMAFFIGHFAGMTPLQTFAVTIFEQLGTSVDKYVATIYLGLVELAGSFVCVVLVHWTGKRPLAFVSTIGNGICFIIVGTYSYLANQSTDIKDNHNWIPVVFLISAAFLSHICIRMLPWILIGEVYPARVRNYAAGASGSVGYIFGFLVNYVYVYMVDGISLAGTFWFYGVVGLLGSSYLYWFLPETEGKTLLVIEQHFAGEINLLRPMNSKKNVGKNVKYQNGATDESKL